MTENVVSTTIEILGKLYPIRCTEAELKSLQHAAEYLNTKMSEIQESGKAINLERIAIMAALNIANELKQLELQKSTLIQRVAQRITHIQEKVDSAINRTLQTELLYTTE